MDIYNTLTFKKCKLKIQNITDISDKRIIESNIELIRYGQQEGAFTCIANLNPSSALNYRALLKMITRETYRVYAILDEESMKVIGYVDFLLDMNKGEIIGIIVSPEFRRQRLGSLLLRIAENTLRDWGAKIVETRILTTNYVSKSFFTRNGYFYTGITLEYTDSCGKTWLEEVWWKFL